MSESVLQRAQRLASDRGLTVAPHGRAWRIYGQGVDLLVARDALATLQAKELAPQPVPIERGEAPWWAHGVRAWDRR